MTTYGQPGRVAPSRRDAAILALLDYLADLHATKNPPVHRVADEGLYALDAKDLPQVPGVILTPSDEIWLRVEYVDLPAAPEVPSALRTLIGTELRANIEPELPDLPDLVEQRLPDGADDDAREALTSQLEPVLGDAVRWVEQIWRPWSSRHADARAAKALYRDLFAQQNRLAVDRDSVELCWGFSRLRWRATTATVDYPLLAAPIEIDIDADTQALTVRPAAGVTVQDSCLAGLDLHDRTGLLAGRDTIAGDPPDPWAPELGDLLRRLVRHVHDHGLLEGEGTPTTGAPLLSRDWTVFLRRRRPDYTGFLDKLRDLYRAGADVPAPLGVLVSQAGSGPADDGSDHSAAHGSSRDQLLLPLAANEEQMRILELAQTRPGVVVQGPPGTGKTHTIANLISHYVAHGQRVLVLAEKERALREVTGKVPAGIRDLTVSVLGADEDSRRQLGASITAIQARVTGLDKDAADHEILRLTGALDTIDKQIAENTDKILRAREAEAQQLPGTWPCGDATTPQVAAAWVHGNEHLGLIPDPLDPAVPIQLTPGELAELVRLIDQLGEDATKALAFLPDPGELFTADELATAHRDLARTQQALKGAVRVKSWERIDASSPETLAALNQEVQKCAALQAAARGGGWLAAISTQMADPLLLAEWHAAARDLAALREDIIRLRGPLTAHEVQLPSPIPAQFAEHLATAEEQFKARGRLGVFARAEKAALAAISIDGRTVSSAQHVALVRTALEVDDARRALRTRWRQQVLPVDGPDLSSGTPEVEVYAPLQTLQAQLALPAEWARIASALKALDIACARPPTSSEVEQVAATVALLPQRAVEQAAARIIDTEIALLEEGGEQDDASPLWDELAVAADAGDTTAYAALLAETERLRALATQAQRLRDLHTTLSTHAPLWAQQILTDTSHAGDPAELPARWAWRQLDQWLQRIQQPDSAATLQRRAEDFAVQRARTVTDLVTERAWRRLADNLDDTARRGLNEYLKAVSKYGKTGGTYKARRVAEIRRAMEQCKNAVPVWVMTSSRALTSFAPEAEPPFDVLILDEASQAGIEDLPLLSLARQTIVVGDDKQTSPENVGLKRERIFELLDDHLAEVSGYRTLFDPDNSLYDLAQLRFPDLVTLVEHFRCLPDIISFSNQQFYEGQIQPLRDKPPHPTWQPLGAIKVTDGYRSGETNQPEAEVVAKLLGRLHEDPQYDGMTFGVVTLLAGGQAKLIDDLLIDRLTPEGYRARQVQVGEPAAFQGAERDVIVVSTVVGTDPANPTGRIHAMNDAKAARRLNVAASRAQQQMWVVHSVDADRFHPDDRRGALIRHCRDPRNAEAVGEVNLARCDSEFERLVLGRIIARGYRRVRVQHEVGSASRNYRIDIVIEGSSRRLAVECDGERWHGPDRWHADRTRQQVLERAGWTFERIRGSAFFRDPDQSLQPLWQRLEELEIHPESDLDDTPQPQVFEVLSEDWAHAHAPTPTRDRQDRYGSVAAAPPREEPARPAADTTVADVPVPPGRTTRPIEAGPAAPSSCPAPAASSPSSRPQPDQPTAALDQAPDVSTVARQLAAVVVAITSHGNDVQAEDAYTRWANRHGEVLPLSRDMRKVLNRALSACLRTGALTRTDGEAESVMAEYYLAGPVDPTPARPVTGTAGSRSAAPPTRTDVLPSGRAPRVASPSEVRAWARRQGMGVGERGHLAEAVWWAYYEAQGHP